MKNDKKPTSAPYHRKQHEAQQHNMSPRLEGVVKNIGTTPVRKQKKLPLRAAPYAEVD